MMNWIYYLLEANFYLILFYGFYRLLLHKETFYVLNRYFLIISSLTAFLIPFFQLGFLSREAASASESVYQGIHTEVSLFNAENVLLFIYTLIVFVFLSKILWGFRFILKLLKKPNRSLQNGITVIELEHTKAAFSFFNMLFIDPELPEKDTILKHEMVHIHQKHSVDVLFFELIKSLSWFNPIVYLLKNDIKLIHEYLADDETTKKGIEKYEYAMFLIQNSYGSKNIRLTNQIFNSSILKRRISMLNQKKSAKWARLRLLLVLPVIGGMLCTSTMAFTKSYGVLDLYPKKIKALNIQPQDTVKKAKTKQIVIAEPIPKSKQVKRIKFAKPLPPPPPIEPATKSKNKKKSMTRPVPPPPPPVEPNPAKGEALKIKFTPPVRSSKSEVLKLNFSPDAKPQSVKKDI